MVFVSILVNRNLMSLIYLFAYFFERNFVLRGINESDMHEHGCSACGKRKRCVILRLYSKQYFNFKYYFTEAKIKFLHLRGRRFRFFLLFSCFKFYNIPGPLF